MCLHYSGEFNRIGVKGSLYNGTGYNGWTTDDNPFKVDFKNDGIFGITEINYKTDYGIYVCGISVHSNVAMYSENTEWQYKATQNTQKKMDFAWWLYTEQRLFEGSGHQVNLLLQYSQNGYMNSCCKRYAGLGVLWEFNDKNANQHGLGLVTTGAEFNENFEIDLEVSYSYQILKNFYIQPSVHLIKDKRELNSVFTLRFLYGLDWHLGR